MPRILLLISLLLPAPDARASSTDTVPSPPPFTGRAITLYGNPAVIKEQPKPIPNPVAQPALQPQTPAEFRGTGPKPQKKKKRREPQAQPPERRSETKPPRRKLVRASWYDKWEPHRVDCEWYLSGTFIPAYATVPAQGLGPVWPPDPQPPVLQYGYWRDHPPQMLQMLLGPPQPKKSGKAGVRVK